MTEKEFNSSLLTAMELSMAISNIAVSKASNNHVKEFASFEVDEARALMTVVKGQGMATPELDDQDKAIIANLTLSKGLDFDKSYINMQLENHQFLRDLAEDYLNQSSADEPGSAGIQCKYTATLALAAFKEHLMTAKKLYSELRNSSNFLNANRIGPTLYA